MKRILSFILLILSLGFGLPANSADVSDGRTDENSQNPPPTTSSIQIPQFKFECAPTTSQYTCTVRTMVTGITAKQFFALPGGLNIENITIQGVAGIILYLEAHTGVGSEILASCQRLAIRAQEAGKQLNVKIDWNKSPDTTHYHDLNKKWLHPVITAPNPDLYVISLECSL
jgi:hypothetical protein